MEYEQNLTTAQICTYLHEDKEYQGTLHSSTQSIMGRVVEQPPL